MVHALAPVPASEPSSSLGRGSGIPGLFCTGCSQAILIVEDDAEVRDTLKLLFDGRGFCTFAARDGDQALAIAANCGMSVDLIVADYNLPGLSGLKVIAKIEEAFNQGKSPPFC